MTHVEASELLPLYALNALEPAEISALEMHVSDCHACARELRSFESAAAGLAEAAPVLAPQARLRERVLASGAQALGAADAHAPGVSGAEMVDAGGGGMRPALSPRPETSPDASRDAAAVRWFPGRILRFPSRVPSRLAAAVLVVALAGGAA
ncbi:MAG: anti-sigma factor family protein, partial [Chloroflexota bacterium]